MLKHRSAGDPRPKFFNSLLVAQLFFQIAGPERDSRREERRGGRERDRIKGRGRQRHDPGLTRHRGRSRIAPVARRPEVLGKTL